MRIFHLICQHPCFVSETFPVKHLESRDYLQEYLACEIELTTGQVLPVLNFVALPGKPGKNCILFGFYCHLLFAISCMKI